MALAVEASELVEIFHEVADILTYLLRFADVLDLDLDEAMASTSADNQRRYRVETSKGSAAKAEH